MKLPLDPMPTRSNGEMGGVTRFLRDLTTRRAWILVAAAFLFFGYHLFSQERSHPLQLYRHLNRGGLCDPYAQPGWLDWNDTNVNAQWRTHHADATCADPPDWLELLRQARHELEADPNAQSAIIDRVAWTRKQTIVLIGDSVDRFALEHFAILTDSPYWASSYSDSRLSGVDEGWDERGVPHHSHIEPLDFRIVNCFIYGVDNQDTFVNQPDVHWPFRSEDRIAELCSRFTSGLENPPSLIGLHSGLWDLALFGRQDGVRAGSTPFSTAQMAFWQDRMDVLISTVRKTWPNVPLWLRTNHRIGELSLASSYDYAIPGTEKPKFFSDQRCGQLRQLQLAAAQKHCLPVNDFAPVWEGHQMQQDKVHPWLHPGGPAYMNMLLHHAWMETEGRSHWAEAPC